MTHSFEMRHLLLAVLALALPVARAANFSYTWDTIVSKQPMPDVQCGDVISVSWPTTQRHGVFRLNDPSGSCPDVYDNTAGQLLVAPSSGGNFTYTIKNEKDFWLTDPVSTSADQTNCDDGYAIMFMTSCPEAGNVGSSPPTVGNTGTPADHRASAITQGASPAAITPPPGATAPPPSPTSGAVTHAGSMYMAVTLLMALLCLQQLL
jgi:hypothetical protein